MDSSEGKMPDASESPSVSTKQRRIAELARKMPGKALYSLSHHIDMEWMKEAYRRTRKDGAAGVDGQTAAEFEENLEENLQELLEQAKSGNYRAPAVRRTYIPKGDGKKKRPIGIPTFADKVLQRAVVMALEPVYEEEFYDFSYGFRPRRSAHNALEALQHQLWKMGGGTVLEVDISSYFDTIDRGLLREILRQRVTDGVLVRLIGKWLNAGVMEDGVLTRPERGTPQGGVISPLLANIYLHEVLDRWWVRDVMPRMRGRAFLIRYADDYVLVFEREEDAHRAARVLPKRFGRYGLKLHPEKTRLVAFRRPSRSKSGRDSDDDPKPGTFDFLGFTHYWAKSRKGRWIPKQKTAKDRFGKALRRVYLWCKWYRHMPVDEQAKMLSKKLAGHYQYYGITGNSRALARFRWEVCRIWRKWLCRRSQRAYMKWEAFEGLLKRNPLPNPRAVHSTYSPSANP